MVEELERATIETAPTLLGRVTRRIADPVPETVAEAALVAPAGVKTVIGLHTMFPETLS